MMTDIAKLRKIMQKENLVLKC